MSEVKVKGSPEVAKYDSSESVTIRLYLEGVVSTAFTEWFRNPSNHEYEKNFTPQLCNVNSEMIQFQTSEASSEKHVKMVRKWIELAVSHSEQAYAERERQQAMQHEKKADAERKRQALQDRLKSV